MTNIPSSWKLLTATENTPTDQPTNQSNPGGDFGQEKLRESRIKEIALCFVAAVSTTAFPSLKK